MPEGVGFIIDIVWRDKRCLLVTLPGLGRPKKPTQVVVLLMPPLRGGRVVEASNTASTVLLPRAEDAGNGYLVPLWFCLRGACMRPACGT